MPIAPSMQTLSDAPRVTDRTRAVPQARSRAWLSAWPLSIGALVFTGVAFTTGRLLMLDTYASLTAGRLISQHGPVLLAAPIAVVYCLWAAAHNRRAAQRRSMGCYLLLALCLPLAVITTPYGLTIIDYYRSVLANPVLTARVSEWQPATFSGVSTQFVIVLLASVAAMGFAYGRSYRPPLMMVAITCTLAAAGAHAVRYQVWFAFAATILIADVMNATSPADDSLPLRRIAARVIPPLAGRRCLGRTHP